MDPKHLEAPGKGEIDYDYTNDILLFKIRDQDYKMSLEFDNIILDISNEGFITGIQIFDASKIFRRPKEELRDVRTFEFRSEVNQSSNDPNVKVIKILLNFIIVRRNKPQVVQAQDFIRDTTNSHLQVAEVHCTAA